MKQWPFELPYFSYVSKQFMLFASVPIIPVITGCSKERSTTSRPIIVPFKRTLQEIIVIESCHLCG
jgi:hypothetical protein